MDTTNRDVGIDEAAAGKRVKRIYSDAQRLRIVEEALAPGPAARSAAAAPPSTSSADIEIERRGARLRLQGAVDTDVVREVLRELSR
jgi:hypothetical protein